MNFRALDELQDKGAACLPPDDYEAFEEFIDSIRARWVRVEEQQANNSAEKTSE